MTDKITDRFEALALPRCSTYSVINVVNGVAEAIVLCIFFEDSLLVGDTVALTL